MKKNNFLIIFSYVSLAILLVSVTFYLNSHYSELYPERMDSPFDAIWPDYSKQYLLNLSWNKTTNIDKEILFNAISNIENHPIVLPNKILSINIINQSQNEIIVEETILQSGLPQKFLLQYSFQPHDQYSILVLDGDAKGSTMIQKFFSIGNSTIINTSIDIHVTGFFTSITFYLKSAIQTYVDDIFDLFIDYVGSSNNEQSLQIDRLYREILHRPVDVAGLTYYNEKLNNENYTLNDIKNELLNSEEKKKILEPYEWKIRNNLSSQTIESINQLYIEILNRPVDEQGLVYYGSLIDAGKLSINDLKEILMTSEEKQNQQQ